MDAVSPAISENPVVLEVLETCHWMVPVFPLNVNVLVDPTQTPPAPLIVPATDTGVYVIAPENPLVTLQAELVTTQ